MPEKEHVTFKKEKFGVHERKCFAEQQAFGPGWVEAESAAALSVVVNDATVLLHSAGKEAKPQALALESCHVRLQHASLTASVLSGTAVAKAV